MPRAHDAGQVALDEGNAGALDRDVGAGAHGDADIGLRQSRRIIHAVAGHGDDPAFGLVLLHDRALFLRHHPGLALIIAELARNGLGGRPVVSGEPDAPPAVRAALPSSLRRRLLYRLSAADLAGERATPRQPGRPP